MTTHPGTGQPTQQSPAKAEPNADVRAYFERLARALTKGDAKAIGTMWAIPALVLDDRAVLPVTSLAEVEQFFGGAKDEYSELGIIDTRADIQRVEWLTERIVIVDVRWPYLDANGNENGAEWSTYTLRREDDGELRMRAIVMRGVVQH